VWRKKFEGRRLRRRRGACGGRVGHHRPAQHPGGVGRETLHAAVCFGDDVPYKMHMVTSPILPSSWLGRKQLSLAGEQPARPVRWARTSQASDSISCSCALPFFASRWSQH
jgi:hypothetical protein